MDMLAKRPKVAAKFGITASDDAEQFVSKLQAPGMTEANKPGGVGAGGVAGSAGYYFAELAHQAS